MIATGKGMPFAKLEFLEKKRLVTIINNFWGKQIDLVTWERVLIALNNVTLPEDIVIAIKNNTLEWVGAEFNPVFLDVVRTAGAGKNDIVGMVDAINRAINADMLFTADTAAIHSWIDNHGAELVVQMTNQQILSLQGVLNSAIYNHWTVETTADLMRQGITLTARETMAVTNHYNRTFISELERFSKAGYNDAITRATNNATFAAQKKTRFLQEVRANRIARTELRRAKGLGDVQAHLQAKKEGLISEASKTWVATNVKDNWASTLLFDGLTAPIDGDFSELYGIPAPSTAITFEFPSEINELCDVEYGVEAAI